MLNHRVKMICWMLSAMLVQSGENNIMLTALHDAYSQRDDIMMTHNCTHDTK